MPHYRSLSYVLNEETPLYGETPSVKIEAVRRMSSGDTANTSLVTLSTHAGTHVDMPWHFFSSGKTVTDFDISTFIFHSPLLVDCKKAENDLVQPDDMIGLEEKLKRCDILLVRTGFHKHRGQNKYHKENPGLSASFAQYLRRNYPNIRMLGLDTISASSFGNRLEGREVHRILLDDRLSSPVLLLEDLYLPYDLSCPRRVFVLPLPLKDMDGAPAAVIAELEDSPDDEP